MTGWPIVRATERFTAEEVKHFMEQDIVRVFGAPKTFVSDNANCFTSQLLKDYMKSRGTKWSTVLAYAPMSNGRAEQLVETMKRSFERLIAGTNKDWDDVVH